MTQSNNSVVNSTVNGTEGRKKTACPITKAAFYESARAINVVIDGVPQVAEVKEFSTGSLGWYLNGKVSQEYKTREEFANAAQAKQVVINGVPMQADVKEFSTGSVGWYLNGKLVVEVGGVRCPVQVGMSLTVVGSKSGEPALDPRVQIGCTLTLVGSKELPAAE